MGCMYCFQHSFDLVMDVLTTCFKSTLPSLDKDINCLTSKSSSNYNNSTKNSDSEDFTSPTNFNYNRRKSSSNILKENMRYNSSIRRNTVASNYLENNNLQFLAIFNSQLIAISKGNNFGLGSLIVTLTYGTLLKNLQVYIVEAKDLLAVNVDKQCNPYLNICIYPGSFDTFKTKSLSNTKNPKFNVKKIYKGIKENDLKKLTLCIKIFNLINVNDSKIIGEIIYPLSLLAESSEENNKKVINFEKNITPSKDITSFLGLLLVSLYLDISKEEFIVSIIKGKDFKAMDRNNLTNPYCIIKLGTSVTKLGSRKTSIKYKTLNPIWNESFQYHVTQKDFDNDLSLRIKVFDKDPVESNVIGEIIFSLESSLNEAHHWKSMIDNKNKPVSEWHSIKRST